MNNYQQTNIKLQVYKQIELNSEKNLQFFLDKHSTKEGSWGHLKVNEGTIDFVFLDGNGNELSYNTLNSQSPSLMIPPASWHKIASTSAKFSATLQFHCQSHRYFEKKHHLAPIHHDLWTIYQTYLLDREKMSILDVGCGSGRNPLYFSLSGHDIIGVDKNEDAIENIRHKSFDFIYSTMALQFLKQSSIKPLLTKMQSLTPIGGMHFLVFPIKAELYSYPENFTYLAKTNELYHFYQDSGWSILEYKEKPGQLHKLDEHGKPKQGIFGQLLAQKHL